MSAEGEILGSDGEPESSKLNKFLRAGLNATGGAIPFVGGILAAGAGAWSEHEQDEINQFLRAQLKMMQEEWREKQRVLAEVVARLDMHDEEIKRRIKSDEYQTILKKAFRNWAGTESQKKQEYVRNLLSNAAAAKFVSDDVVMLFLDWLHKYSEFHFSVVAEIYRAPGLTRGEIWEQLGKAPVAEISAEADLFKLLIRDLSMGGIIRQHRDTDGHGNFIAKRTLPARKGTTSRIMSSAFDDKDQYELTALGQQFIHYVMTELTPKISYRPTENDSSQDQPSTPDDKDDLHAA